MTDRKPRSDKGTKRVEHSGYDRIYTFKLNAMLESGCVTLMDALIDQKGSIKEAMRFLLTGDSQPVSLDAQSIEAKLNYIMATLEALGNGKVSTKKKSAVIDAVKDYCNSLSDFMS